MSAEPPAFVGRLVDGAHAYEPIRHYGLAPVLPCRLDAAWLADTAMPACESPGRQEAVSP